MEKGVAAALQASQSVRQAGRQAGRKTEVRVLLFLLCFSLMASACLNHSSPRQEPGPGMNSPLRSETEHRAHLVSLMCCMGQCYCFFHTLASSVLAHYGGMSLCKSHVVIPICQGWRRSEMLPLCQGSGKNASHRAVLSKRDLIDC